MATESFFSNASLAYLASAGAGKDGKAYSIKPTDGTGDFTFSRGSNLAATRIGADGLIEKGRENLLLQSNQFDTTWSKSSGVTLTSGQSGYDGSSDAWESSFTAGTRYFGQTISQIGVITISTYVKAGNHDFIQFVTSTSTTAYVNFDISSSSAAKGTEGSGVIDSSITSVGSDWYRCSMSFNNTSLGTFYVWMIDSKTSQRASSVSTAGTILIQDAQLEIGLAATDYIESGATTGKAGLLEDEPRFDYSGGATCPSLLLEPSRTQLVSYSEYPTAFFGSDIEFTTSPDGSLNAAKIIEQNTNSQHFVTFSALNVAASTTYAISFYCKKGSYSSIYVPLQSSKINANLSINFDTQSVTLAGPDSVINSEFIESVENGWYRVGFSATANSSGTMDFYACISTSLSSYQGDGTSYTEFYGFQVEEGSYPTSYIPNHSGGSVTRGADDSLANSNFSSIFGASSLTQYTIFFEVFKAVDSGTSTTLINKGTNDQGRVNYLGGDRLVYYSTATGYTTGNNITDGNPHKYLLSADNGTIKQFFDGVLIDTNTNALDELTSINIGGDNKNLNISQYLIFPETLSDADCIALTS